MNEKTTILIKSRLREMGSIRVVREETLSFLMLKVETGLGFDDSEDSGCSLPKSCCLSCFNLFSSRDTLAMLVIEPSTHKVYLSSLRIPKTKIDNLFNNPV